MSFVKAGVRQQLQVGDPYLWTQPQENFPLWSDQKMGYGCLAPLPQ